MKYLLAAFTLTLLTLVGSRPAQASLTFPAELQQHLGIDALPAPAPYCTLCHRNDSGGAGTITRPLGLALLSRGALGNNIASLDAALDQLEAGAVDSDHDGVADTVELREGTDPNQGSSPTASPLVEVPLPQTGCSVNGSGVSSWLAPFCLYPGLLVLVWRRRRRGGCVEQCACRTDAR
jgi:hypothetical protein